MAGAANNKGKQTPFKKGPQKGVGDVRTVPYGKPSVMLKNVQEQAAQSKGSPRPAKIITNDPKHPNKWQMDNLKKLGAAKYGQGDNPFKGE